MENQPFLAKLHKEKKIQLIEPNENVKESYLEKSESNLMSAKLLFDNAKLEEAVALCYYSMYHSLIALLFRAGIKCENHTGAIILLNKLFGLDNSKIAFAKKERVDKQYYTDFHITKKEVDEMIRIAENFNGDILDFISKLNAENVTKYRNLFASIFNKKK